MLSVIIGMLVTLLHLKSGDSLTGVYLFFMSIFSTIFTNTICHF